MTNKHLIVDMAMDKVPDDLFSNPDLMDYWLACVPEQYTGDYAFVTQMEDGRKQISVEKPLGFENMSLVEGEYTMESTLEAMDESGIDIAIIRVPVWQEWMTLDLCKLVNDDYAKFTARSEGRLKAMASIPPWGDRASLYELERCIKELGFCGIQLSCHYGTRYLDDESFRPLLKVLNDENIPVCVRNVPLPVDYKSITKYNNIRRKLGREIDALTGVCLELYSDIFEEFPNLKFIHGYLGGAWYAFNELMRPKERASKSEATKRFDTDIGERIERYVKNNLFFEITHPSSWGKRQLECAIEVCGADHYVFGCMIPVFPGKKDVEAIRTLDITEEEKDMILGGNAISLLCLQ